MLLTPADIANLKCVDRYWRGVAGLIEEQRAHKVNAIVNSGTSRFWSKSNFLRLRSTMVPRHSVICSKYLRIYKTANHIHLLTPSGVIVGIIDKNNVVYRSHSLWAKLYDAILLVLDSLPPTMTLGRFCTHCPFCGKGTDFKCTCALKWAGWFSSLLPKRVCVDRSIFRLSEDLSLFCDCHVLVNDGYDCNCYH